MTMALRSGEVKVLITINAAGSSLQKRAGIIDNAKRARVHQVLNAWHTAIGSEPTTPESAGTAIKTTRDLLATIPVLDVQHLKRPADVVG